MTAKTIKPYGEWRSPITTEVLVADSVRLDSVALDGEDVYWLEGRPADGGRYVLVRRAPDGELTDVTPAPFNVRTRVHEYGGGSYLVAGRRVWFSNFSDQRLYYHPLGEEPAPLTPPGPFRYADLRLDARRGRIICVRETHAGGDREAHNELVAVSLESGESRVLASGHDFYSGIALSPDGGELAWITWDHPNMPWDASEVWRADFGARGELGPAQRIAGGEGVSVYQPSWSHRGELFLVSDAGGWWNLYRWCGGVLSPILESRTDFGRPQWQLGTTTYGFISDQHVLCARCDAGRWELLRLNVETGNFERLCSEITSIDDLAVSGERAVILAGAPDRPSSVLLVDVARGATTSLKEAWSAAFATSHLSTPESIEFPTSDGDTAHGFFYAPVNAHFDAPERDHPPLIVMSHGGPTGSTATTLDLRIQFWTSRGFAVLDVNYRGSTGYGRAYRDRLKGRWGEADVADCVHGALFLSERGRVDRERLAIRGGSAGGFTTLCALTFHDVFKAGASYYGISDLEALARDTHKFESRYLDQLIGPYPERADLYRARSPLHCVDRLSCPVIFFQGLEDEVVPPNQADMMVAALRAKGLPVAYLTFEGEQHGFRRAETIERTLRAELYFYGRVFGFTPSDRLDPIEIENLS